MATRGFAFRQIGRDLEAQYGAGALGRSTLDLYRMLLSSPYFSAIMSQAALGSTLAGQQTRAALGRAGGLTTGVGAVQSGVASSLLPLLMTQARGNLFGTALEASGQNIGQRLATHGYAAQMIPKGFDWNQLLGSLIGGAGMALPLLFPGTAPMAAWQLGTGGPYSGRPAWGG
jgi:hypothetical protein